MPQIKYTINVMARKENSRYRETAKKLFQTPASVIEPVELRFRLQPVDQLFIKKIWLKNQNKTRKQKANFILIRYLRCILNNRNSKRCILRPVDRPVEFLRSNSTTK